MSDRTTPIHSTMEDDMIKELMYTEQFSKNPSAQKAKMPMSILNPNKPLEVASFKPDS